MSGGCRRESKRRRMGDLEEGLLVEVLVRLGCRNVLRLKLVCKRWMCLISSSMFIRYFMDISRKQHHHWSFIVLAPFSTWTGAKEVRFFGGCGYKNFSFGVPLFFKPGLSFLPPNEKSVFVVGSFNDLLLCSSSSNRGVCYYICNPVSMQFVALPPPPSSVDYCCVGFICEPFYSLNKDGELKYDYRCRVVLGNSAPLELEIFSSETGLWTKNKLTLLGDGDGDGVGDGVGRGVGFCKLVAFQNGQMMLFRGKIAIKFDAFAAGGGDMIKGDLVRLPERLYDHNTYIRNNGVMTSQGRLFLVDVLFVGSPVINPCNLKVLEYYSDDDDDDHDDNEQQQHSSSNKWKLIHHIRFSEMKVIPCCDDDITSQSVRDWVVSKASPYDRQHRRTWLGNFIKYFVWGGGSGCWASCVGFHLTLPNLMYLILSPPRPIPPSLATYDMHTRAIQLVSMNNVPPHLGCLRGAIASHHIFPFVQQPWPTPLPTLY